jgi:hypothetical protein
MPSDLIRGWVPVFPRDKREAFARRSCSNKTIERDDDSKWSHPALSALAWTRRRVSRMRFNSWRQGTAMNVDDFRLSIDTASSEVGRRSGAATEGPAFAAAVVPLRKIPPTYANQRLSPDRLRQIDRVFYGPFFREKYGMGGDKALENGRIRYYGPVHPGSPRAENHLSPGSCGRRLIESPFESGHKEIRNAATSVAES